MPSYAIIGASKGIGSEFVRQLVADTNNTVLAIGRNVKSPGIAEFGSNQPNLHIIQGDPTDPNSILEAASAAAAITDGKLDVLIYNSNAVDLANMATNPTQIPFDAEATRAIFEPSISTAVYGGLWATNAFLPLIEKGVEKKIVHISTAMSDVTFIHKAGIPNAVAYAVAKAGMNVQVAKYAVELAPKGIKLLALSPGWVDTWKGEKPPPVVESNKALLKMFQKVDPELKGQIQPEESVSKCLQVIEHLDAENSGFLLSHNGNRKSWV